MLNIANCSLFEQIKSDFIFKDNYDFLKQIDLNFMLFSFFEIIFFEYLLYIFFHFFSEHLVTLCMTLKQASLDKLFVQKNPLFGILTGQANLTVFKIFFLGLMLKKAVLFPRAKDS